MDGLSRLIHVAEFTLHDGLLFGGESRLHVSD